MIETDGQAGKLPDTMEHTEKALFTFSTAKLSKTEKVRFFYALKGRGSSKGILEDCNGVHLGPGVVLIPTHYSAHIERFLSSFGSEYSRREIWIPQPSRRIG